MLAGHCRKGHWIVGDNARAEKRAGRTYYRCATFVRAKTRESMRRKRGSVRRYDLSERESISRVFVLKRGSINADRQQGATPLPSQSYNPANDAIERNRGIAA